LFVEDDRQTSGGRIRYGGGDRPYFGSKSPRFGSIAVVPKPRVLQPQSTRDKLKVFEQTMLPE
jgi:hypothetical protein